MLPSRNIALHKRLTAKFVGIAFISSLAPLLFLFFYSTESATSMLKASLRDNLQEKSFLVGADIDRYFTQREHDVRVLSQADVLETDNIESIIQYLTEVIKETPYLNDIDIIDPSGIVIASSGEQNESGKHVLELYPELKTLFSDAQNSKQGDIFVSEILELDNGAGLAFLTPITDDTNTIVIKTLLVEINLDIVKKIVADFDDRVIGDKYVYLVNNDGNVIVTADPRVKLLDSFPDLFVQHDLLDKFSDQGEVGSIIYKDAEGREVMAGFADMAEFGVNRAMDWSIIAIAPIDDITLPVKSFQISLMYFTLIAFAISTAMLFFLSKNILSSVAKLVEGARRVGGGDFDYRVDTGQKDEFGYLADTINNTLDKLMIVQNEANAANHAKSAFLASMSHEIRTPMTGIMGMTDLLVKSELNSKQKDWAHSIKSSSDTLLTILNEILDQSKLEAGKMKLDPVDFNLIQFFEEQVSLFTPKVATKNLSIELNIDSNVPKNICADRLRIGQVLSNFLGNSLKFTERGCISVSVSARSTATATNGLEKRDTNYIHILVNDTGIGMNNEALSNLFQSFSQADSSISRNYGGTGLGLSISKQLTQLMGGEIGVQSFEGVGSQFWFSFKFKPVDKEFVEISRDVYFEEWRSTRSLNILVVEDAKVNQYLMLTILEDLDHHVVVADNGKIALEKLETGEFDLILMDIRMPVMDGIEATQIIRNKNGKLANIPIIAITADISVGNITEYTEKGMNAVCSKPLELDELLPAINTHLNEEIHTFVDSDETSEVTEKNKAEPVTRIASA